MKLCIPVIEDNGLYSKVSDHFGRAPMHVVVDLESGDVSSLTKDNECGEESHGNCMPVDLMIANDVKMVACKGIGRGAVNRLIASKIGVFATKAACVEEVLKEYRESRLQMVNEEQICAGHDHH